MIATHLQATYSSERTLNLSATILAVKNELIITLVQYSVKLNFRIFQGINKALQ